MYYEFNALMLEGDGTGILLITSCQFLYLFARSENMKHNKTIFFKKVFLISLPLGFMHKTVAIKSANIAKL